MKPCLYLPAFFLATLATVVRAAAPETGPRLGLQTWTCRNLAFEQVVDFAVQHHLKYLEFAGVHLDPAAPREETLRKKALLEQHGLVAYSFGVSKTSLDKEANRRLFEFARLMGMKMIVVEPKNMAEWDNLEELVKEYDIKLAIHNHNRETAYGDPAKVKQVLAARDRRIGVCLDVGWVTAAGFDAAAVFRDYGDRVYDLHFKDKKIELADGKPVPIDTEIGRGSANYEGLFAAIKKTGWAGVMAIETDSAVFATNPRQFVAEAGAFFAAHVPPPPPPNIVFIFSDDHAYQAISAYGEARRLLATPNLDRIAQSGLRFDRCVVPNSICGPSRATVLTGKYNHLNGFYNNTNCRFDGAQLTFPKLLRQAGYQTAMIGKWHLGSDPTGFDFWQVLPGQGAYYNPPMIRNGERIKVDGYVTDIITDLSLDWLEHRDKAKPFLLMCQHKAPHRRWEPALRHLAADGDRKYPEPPTLFDDYAGRGLAEHDQDMTIEKTMDDIDLKLVPPPDLTAEQRKAWDAYYDPRNAAFRAAKLEGKALVSWKYQRYLHDYLACLRAVDESVGRVLDYLEQTGLAGNTIVVYASDQGFFLGEHGWFDKRWIFEESLRTPLLVRWPGVTQPGSVNRDLVSNLDFAETFLAAAGVPVPAEMQGRSFVPLLRGERPADWRTSFYYQYYEYPTPHHVRPHYGVVTDRYKLVRFYGAGEDYWELFDLEQDPQELRSVYGEPAYAATQEQLARELARLRAELKAPESVPPEWFGDKPMRAGGPTSDRMRP